MPESVNIQATAVAVGDRGVLIRGPAGAGKSLLALSLIDHATSQAPVALISDDLVIVEQTGPFLTMQAPPTCRGQIELRFFGIVARPVRTSAQLHLVVDFEEDAPRLPETADQNVRLFDQEIARQTLPLSPRLDVMHQLMIVRSALARMDG